MSEPAKKPYSGFRFWRIAVGKGWDKSREKFGLVVDLVLVLTAIGLFVLAWYSKRNSSFNEEHGEAKMSYWFAIIPAALWLLWFFYHVLKAPHEIYIELYGEHQKEVGDKENTIQAMAVEIQSLKAEHRRKFLAFMAQLKSRAMTTAPVDWGEFYQNVKPNIRHEIALIMEDFSPEQQVELETLAAAACDLTARDIHNYGNHTEIMERVEKVVQFVKSQQPVPQAGRGNKSDTNILDSHI